MNLRQWLAVPYDGPGRKRAAIILAVRDLADRLADGEPGLLRWRWRASLALRSVPSAIDAASRWWRGLTPSRRRP